MSLKDKLEIGLKPDAPYRRDNLPEFQKDDPACEIAATPGDSEELRKAREACEEVVPEDQADEKETVGQESEPAERPK